MVVIRSEKKRVYCEDKTPSEHMSVAYNINK